MTQHTTSGGIERKLLKRSLKKNYRTFSLILKTLFFLSKFNINYRNFPSEITGNHFRTIALGR